LPEDKVEERKAFPRFRAAIHGGLSYTLGRMPDNIPVDFEQYARDLRSGRNFGVDLSFYFTENYGIGIKYLNFNTRNELDNIFVQLQDGTRLYGKMSDNITIEFLGPFFSTRFLNANHRNAFIINAGIGYVGWVNRGVLISNVIMNGNTLGSMWDIGYDIGLSDHLALGIQLSYMHGVLTHFELLDGAGLRTVELEREDFLSLSRLDLSIGLRF